jgi:hypothetical protein
MFRLVAIVLAIVPTCVAAQRPDPTDELRQLPQITRASGLIFSGTVLAIEHLASTETGQADVTQITFRVESAIRGARKGQRLQIREWAGLWNAGERYRVGERWFLFFYPQSKLGLTSIVGGKLGRYSLNDSGGVLVGGSPGRPSRPIPLQSFNSMVRRSAER